MTRSRIALILIPLTAATLLLTGCQPPSPAPQGSSDSATPSDTATPPPPEPAGPVFALPSGCDTIASQVTLNTVFSGVAERPGEPALVRPAPSSATKLLTCSWFTGDTTGGDIIYYSAPAADSAAYLSVVEADGFTCAEALEGTRCDKTTPMTQYPVDLVETVFTRDDVWIYIGMTNLDAAPLLPDVVATAWAA